jgi:alpha-glucosidase
VLLYLNKIPHPANFVFNGSAEDFEITCIGGDVHRIRARRPMEWVNPSQARLAESVEGRSSHTVQCREDGTLEVLNRKGRAVLATVPGATYGQSGDTWMLQFRHERAMQFYGLGEHSRGFEKTGQRARFWNTDLIADFAWDEVRFGFPNPMYVAIPWLIVKRGNFYVGLLVHHPGAVFMELASNFVWDVHNSTDRERRSFYLGAPDGAADVYVIVGPSLAELTQKMQQLVGTTPLPPLWALGYHQSRWGYAGPKDLNAIDREMTKRRIPCDGLWLDIDYMDRLKVFTFSVKHWGNDEDTARALATLRSHGRRVVPILDPGVKVEPGYDVHDSGLTHDTFCHNRTGRPYVGFAWPGQTLFPDFSLPSVREWWSEHVEKLARLGIAAAWIDMNDPSTGGAEVEDMLFDRGRQPHADYHNQYALGMADATRTGFLSARPEERPFVLSRSAYLTSGRFTAVWTGDNLSNWHHLRMAIPVTLGLALSGIPFCGPDVCGFGLDATPELAIAWHKLQFLFPFFRNHSATGVREQEPWKFGAATERILVHYIRLRYKFLPYLYQLFIEQEKTGAAILRPLFYDFPDRIAQPLGKIDDQFLVGPAILQAPFVHENNPEDPASIPPGTPKGRKPPRVKATATRNVVLPSGVDWYSLSEGRWVRGGVTLRVAPSIEGTPLFVRGGSVLPLRAGLPEIAKSDLREVELHVFLPPKKNAIAATLYHADDGETYGYQRGIRTSIGFVIKRPTATSLEIRYSELATGFGPLQIRIVDYARSRSLTVIHDLEQRLPMKAHGWRATGVNLSCTASPFFTVGDSEAQPLG